MRKHQTTTPRCHRKCWSLRKLLEAGHLARDIHTVVPHATRCPGSLTGSNSCALTCPLGVCHPPQGEEFALSCTLCETERGGGGGGDGEDAEEDSEEA